MNQHKPLLWILFMLCSHAIIDNNDVKPFCATSSELNLTDKQLGVISTQSLEELQHKIKTFADSDESRYISEEIEFELVTVQNNNDYDSLKERLVTLEESKKIGFLFPFETTTGCVYDSNNMLLYMKIPSQTISEYINSNIKNSMMGSRFEFLLYIANTLINNINELHWLGLYHNNLNYQRIFINVDHLINFHRFDIKKIPKNKAKKDHILKNIIVKYLARKIKSPTDDFGITAQNYERLGLMIIELFYNEINDKVDGINTIEEYDNLCKKNIGKIHYIKYLYCKHLDSTLKEMISGKYSIGNSEKLIENMKFIIKKSLITLQKIKEMQKYDYFPRGSTLAEPKTGYATDFDENNKYIREIESKEIFAKYLYDILKGDEDITVETYRIKLLKYNYNFFDNIEVKSKKLTDRVDKRFVFSKIHKVSTIYGMESTNLEQIII